MADYAAYVKLLFDYADQDILTNGNYDAQVSSFAQGKTAFINQGNWVDPNMKQLGVTFKMGYISTASPTSRRWRACSWPRPAGTA